MCKIQHALDDVTKLIRFDFQTNQPKSKESADKNVKCQHFDIKHLNLLKAYLFEDINTNMFMLCQNKDNFKQNLNIVFMF